MSTIVGLRRSIKGGSNYWVEKASPANSAAPSAWVDTAAFGDPVGKLIHRFNYETAGRRVRREQGD